MAIAEPGSGDASADSSTVGRTAAPDADARGEYNRLSQEMASLVSKSAWGGVERTFQQLLATGVPLTFEDWVHGAEAARAVGDLAAVRARLISAMALQEDRRVLDWLWDLDQRYGSVLIQCQPGTHLLLEPEVTTFDPEIRRAIELARQRLREECRFEGLLPIGRYTLHYEAFEVLPHKPVIEIDLRGIRLDRATRRKSKDARGEH